MNDNLFADDINVVYSYKNINVLEEVVNAELNCIFDWWEANKLNLDTIKQNFMTIKLRQQKLPKKIQLNINGEHLFGSNYAKFLGVLIDHNLTWKQHI